MKRKFPPVYSCPDDNMPCAWNLNKRRKLLDLYQQLRSQLDDAASPYANWDSITWIHRRLSVVVQEYTKLELQELCQGKQHCPDCRRWATRRRDILPMVEQFFIVDVAELICDYTCEV